MNRIDWDSEELRLYFFRFGDNVAIAATCTGVEIGPGPKDERGFLRAEVYWKTTGGRGFNCRGRQVNALALEHLPGTPHRDAFRSVADRWVLTAVWRELAIPPGEPEGLQSIAPFAIDTEAGDLNVLAAGREPLVHAIQQYSEIEPAKQAAHTATDWAVKLEILGDQVLDFGGGAGWRSAN